MCDCFKSLKKKKKEIKQTKKTKALVNTKDCKFDQMSDWVNEKNSSEQWEWDWR